MNQDVLCTYIEHGADCLEIYVLFIPTPIFLLQSTALFTTIKIWVWGLTQKCYNQTILNN